MKRPKTKSEIKRRSEPAASGQPVSATAPQPVESQVSFVGPAGPVVRLLPYQRRWVSDESPLKIIVKARQIGFSFAATIRAVFKCLERKSTWILLSKGERQSRLLMEKVQDHVQ